MEFNSGFKGLMPYSMFKSRSCLMFDIQFFLQPQLLSHREHRLHTL